MSRHAVFVIALGAISLSSAQQQNRTLEELPNSIKHASRIEITFPRSESGAKSVVLDASQKKLLTELFSKAHPSEKEVVVKEPLKVGVASIRIHHGEKSFEIAFSFSPQHSIFRMNHRLSWLNNSEDFFTFLKGVREKSKAAG